MGFGIGLKSIDLLVLLRVDKFMSYDINCNKNKFVV